MAEPVEVILPFAAEGAMIARDRLLSHLRSLSARPDECDDARLVVSELVGNAVRHARPLGDGTVRVSWAIGPHGLDIAVSDGGARSRPERIDSGISDLSGRGLSIVETIATRWWVETSRTRTTVHALLRLT